MNGDIITGIHPYADKFPMLPDAELDELAESIANIGLINPIVVDPAGLVLDGRNRLEACNRAQVEVTTTVYEGNDIAEFVIGCNVTRRNMSTGARAMATALIYLADGRRIEKDGGGFQWRPGTVEIHTSVNLRSWQQRINECGIVLDYKPHLAEQVVNGSVALKDAFTQAEAIRTSAERDKIMAREKAKRAKAEAEAEAQRNAEIIADLTQAGATKYLDMVNTETMTPAVAWAAYREDTRKERERAEQERKALTQQFSDIAHALRNLGSWGAYDDPIAVMSNFNPDEHLNPPMMFRFFDLDNIEAAHRMTAELITWRKNYAR